MPPTPVRARDAPAEPGTLLSCIPSMPMFTAAAGSPRPTNSSVTGTARTGSGSRFIAAK